MRPPIVLEAAHQWTDARTWWWACTACPGVSRRKHPTQEDAADDLARHQAADHPGRAMPDPYVLSLTVRAAEREALQAEYDALREARRAAA